MFHHLLVSDAHDIDKPNFQNIYSGCCTVAAQSYSSGRLICEVLERLKPVGVDEHLEDGARLDHAGKTRMIFTLGHTPGHTSLYPERPKVLIAGDAPAAEGGCLNGPNPPLTLDMRAAVPSIGRLADLELGIIVCYHGSVVGEDANKQLRRVIQEVPRERDE